MKRRGRRWMLCLVTVCAALTVWSGLLWAEGSEGLRAEASGERTVLPGYENTIWGVTGPDGQVISGYTWEMYNENVKERAKEGIRLSFARFTLNFPDQKPILDQGRVLVPMRPVFESVYVQCRVNWDEALGLATVVDQRGRQAEFRPGEHSYTIHYGDGSSRSYPLDVPATILNGRVMLPLRALLENYAYKVSWFGDEQLIFVEDTRPVWRTLLKAEEWQRALEEDCVPCALVREAW